MCQGHQKQLVCRAEPSTLRLRSLPSTRLCVGRRSSPVLFQRLGKVSLGPQWNAQPHVKTYAPSMIIMINLCLRKMCKHSTHRLAMQTWIRPCPEIWIDLVHLLTRWSHHLLICSSLLVHPSRNDIVAWPCLHARMDEAQSRSSKFNQDQLHKQWNSRTPFFIDFCWALLLQEWNKWIKIQSVRAEIGWTLKNLKRLNGVRSASTSHWTWMHWVSVQLWNVRFKQAWQKNEVKCLANLAQLSFLPNQPQGLLELTFTFPSIYLIKPLQVRYHRPFWAALEIWLAIAIAIRCFICE